MKKRAITEEKMEATYKKCLKMENDRECSWRKSKQGKFESSKLSFDRLVDSFPDLSKAWIFSDRGRGARLIRSFGKDPIGEINRRISKARKRIWRSDPSLLKVFNLVLKNGTDREKSICEMMQNKPLRGRQSSRGI